MPTKLWTSPRCGAQVASTWAITDNNFVRIDQAGHAQVYDWNDGGPKVNSAELALPKAIDEDKL